MNPKHALETQVEEAAQQAGGLLRSRFGIWVVGAISFVESALPVPVITDPFMVAYILANKEKTKRAVLITTLMSLLGGLFAYAIAFLFYEFIAAQYLHGAIGEQFAEIVEQAKDGVFWVTLAGAVTPIPYTLAAMGAGFMKASVSIFIVATILGRGGRYIVVGYLTYRFGEQALEIARKHMWLATLVLIVAAVVYFIFLH